MQKQTKVGRNSDRITDNVAAFRHELERRNAVSEVIPADYQRGADKLAEYRRFQLVVDAILAVLVFGSVGAGLVGFFF